MEKIEDIGDLIPKHISRKKANEIVNSLKICDPAVGSGHFLVSALNEIIAIKNDLKILQDKEGKSFHWYEITVENDELTIIDQDGDLFQYHPGNKESQRVQETLFHEKETIIENCLFGVDINPNSVKICRLRLWIELLKNAYYKASPNSSKGGELETLPNIDINIKCGNSLVSRFAIDADLKQALKKSKWSIDSYKVAVDTYRNAESKDEKREMEKMIEDIKNNFSTEIDTPLKKDLRNARGKAESLATKILNLNAFGEKPDKKLLSDHEKAAEALKKLEVERDETINNKIYENSFEWRFEFPEVLNDDGDFVGFDVLIGNPPYIRIQSLNELAEKYKNIFKSAQTGNYDIYVLFIEKSIQLLNKNGNIQFILPHKFLLAVFGKGIRELLYKNRAVSQLINFGHEMIFEGATTYTCLLSLSRIGNSKIKFAEISSKELKEHFTFTEIDYQSLSTSDSWIFKQNKSLSLIQRLENQPYTLHHFLDKIFSGIQTSADQVYLINGEETNGMVTGQNKLSNEKVTVERELVKPLIKGFDIKRYSPINTNVFVIFPYLLKDGNAHPMSEKYIETNFPLGFNYLKKHEKILRSREKGKLDVNDKWFLYIYPKNLFSSYQAKLVSPDITLGMNVTKERGNFCVKNGAYGITIKSEFQIFENEIVGILNSKLLWYYLKNTGNVLRGGYFRFNTKYIFPFPVPELSEMDTNVLSRIVEKVFNEKSYGFNTTDLENQIDQLVYQLYGLTEEEINIVEGV
jgi:hypothetical protein